MNQPCGIGPQTSVLVVKLASYLSTSYVSTRYEAWIRRAVPDEVQGLTV